MSLDKIINVALDATIEGEADNAFRLARKRYANGERLLTINNNVKPSAREQRMVKERNMQQGLIDLMDLTIEQLDEKVAYHKRRAQKAFTQCRIWQITAIALGSTAAGAIAVLLIVL